MKITLILEWSEAATLLDDLINGDRSGSDEWVKDEIRKVKMKLSDAISKG